MLEVYRSSRLERLADLLLVKMHGLAPKSVLQPQRILVGHLGMKRWLMRHLAERSLVDGKPGIVANLQLQLPGEWLDELARVRLGTAQISIDPYQRSALRWRIFALLPGLGVEQIQRYLSGAQAQQRGFQLADRLASLYVQYAVYRPDWLAAWEGRRSVSKEIAEHWQGDLWRRLSRAIGKPHRALRGETLLAGLRADTEHDDDALHVFGVNHLPPDVLHTLLTLAQRQPVLLYFPDPCREVWEDLRRRAPALLETSWGEQFHSEHPLLAALGRLGQQFTVLLNGNAELIDDRRDELDSAAETSGAPDASLLQRLQHSIRVLRADFPAADPNTACTDASLRVHGCHTRLRELEALRDALLQFLQCHTDAEPRDIVVMAPDIGAYAPFLAGVFGQAGRHQGPLPYHLADVPLRRTHPLIHAVAELLELPQQRIGRSQVMSLLDLPAVGRRLGLGAGSIASLSRWLDRAEVAWALDGPMKADFGAAPVAQNSFAFGVERMLAGYMFGNEAEPLALDEEILPAAPPAGPEVDALGALDQLLEQLRLLREGMKQSRSLSAWSDWLTERLAAMFQGDPEDSDERQALRAIEACVERLRGEAQAAEVDPSVPWPVVHEALRESLDGVPQRQPFLIGGITFCGMVPQRAIPFRMVCVLGLNDGEFPRNRSDSGLDLLRTHPRLGDRDSRADDRYLFLEALLSARDALHLSYLGEGVQDGAARNPASPLAELLQYLDQAQGMVIVEPDKGDRPWLIKHPLQPFDRRYYDGEDRRLHSFDSRWLAAATPAESAERGRPNFRQGLPVSSAVPADVVELDQLCRWYRDPARSYCRDILGLDLRALDEAAEEDREPLEIRLEPLERLTNELVWRALRRDESEIPATIPIDFARSGRLPAGALGLRTYAMESGVAQRLLDALRAAPPFNVGNADRSVESIDVDLAINTQLRVRGEIAQVHRVGDHYYVVELGASVATFKQLLPLYIRLAALRLHLGPEHLVRGVLVAPPGRDLWPDRFPIEPARLREGLARLHLLRHRGQSQPQPYFPKSSWRYCKDGNIWGANDDLQGGFDRVGELDFAPGYARLLFDDLQLTDLKHPDRDVFIKRAQFLYRIIDGEDGAA